jgi:hypothetical protein
MKKELMKFLFHGHYTGILSIFSATISRVSGVFSRSAVGLTSPLARYSQRPGGCENEPLLPRGSRVAGVGKWHLSEVLPGGITAWAK